MDRIAGDFDRRFSELAREPKGADLLSLVARGRPGSALDPGGQITPSAASASLTCGRRVSEPFFSRSRTWSDVCEEGMVSRNSMSSGRSVRRRSSGATRFPAAATWMEGAPARQDDLKVLLLHYWNALVEKHYIDVDARGDFCKCMFDIHKL